MRNPFKSSKEKFECNQDPSTGAVKCRSFREFEDGTRQETAGMDFQFDSNCKGVATNVFESEPGALEKLEKKTARRLKDKCEQTPSDY